MRNDKYPNELFSFPATESEKVREAKPQYCMVSFSRFQGGNPYFVGSEVKHMGGVSLRIKTAERCVEHGREWFFGDKNILELRMTSVQFAELISTMNVGDGQPATLLYAFPHPDLAKIPEYVPDMTVDKIVEQGNESLAQTQEIIRRSEDLVRAMVADGRIRKSVGEELAESLREARRRAAGNEAYAKSNLTSHVSKLAVDMKSDVEAYIAHRITEAGILSLRQEADRMLSDGKEEAPLLNGGEQDGGNT